MEATPFSKTTVHLSFGLYAHSLLGISELLKTTPNFILWFSRTQRNEAQCVKRLVVGNSLKKGLVKSVYNIIAKNIFKNSLEGFHYFS